jgi:hypothetical protein
VQVLVVVALVQECCWAIAVVAQAQQCGKVLNLLVLQGLPGNIHGLRQVIAMVGIDDVNRTMNGLNDNRG